MKGGEFGDESRRPRVLDLQSFSLFFSLLHLESLEACFFWFKELKYGEEDEEEADDDIDLTGSHLHLEGEEDEQLQ